MSSDLDVVKDNPMLCLSVCVFVFVCTSLHLSVACVCSRLQIYEDSIVIKSVFESARQRIVTDEEQKEAVSAGHSDNGGGAEDQFVPSAGKC